MTLTERVARGDIDLSVSHGQLVMTFASEALVVCTECPHLHVVVIDSASAAKLRQLAAGLVHLAEHLDGRQP